MSEFPAMITECLTPIEIYSAYCKAHNRKASYSFAGWSHVGHLPLIDPTKATPLVTVQGVSAEEEKTRLDAYGKSLILNNQEWNAQTGAYARRFKSMPEYANALVAIFENNCFKIRTKEDTADAWAVVVHAVRLNHSCVPNCNVSWNKQTGKLEVYAVRDIYGDEELTIAYDAEDHFFDLWTERQTRLLERYGFVCHCPACQIYNNSDTFWLVSEKRRKKIVELANEVSMDSQIKRLQLMAVEARGTWEAGKA